MATAKQQLSALLENQPDDSSMEELVKELAFRAMVERGVGDSDAGRRMSNEEMAEKLMSWRG